MRKIVNYVLIFTFILALFILFADLFHDISGGGHKFKQGDWLINNHNGAIRRGVLGSGLLWLHDVTGIPLLWVTAIIQGIFAAILFCLTWAIAMRLTRLRIYWILVLSSTNFIIFWAAEPVGAMRKEMIGFAALACVTYACYGRFRTLGLVGGMVLFAIAVLGHEANVLLAPAFAFILALSYHRDDNRRYLVPVLIGASVVIAVGGMVYALHYSGTTQSAYICLGLAQRGVHIDMCRGAILAMEQSIANATAVTKPELLGRGLILLLAGYAVALPPIIFVISRHNHQRLLYALLALSFCAIAPLFVVGTDWGRWMNMHLTSFIFIVLALALTQRIRLERPVAPSWVMAAVFYALCLSPSHALAFYGYDFVVFGVFKNLFNTVTLLFQSAV